MSSVADDGGEGIEYRILYKVEGGQRVGAPTDRDAWVELGIFKGRNPREAVRKAVAGAKEPMEATEYAAVPVRNWNDEKVTVNIEPVITFG